ncbi:hypothetical protein EB061_05405 [bacterium]|nr:hypothetical protein [bacterium]
MRPVILGALLAFWLPMAGASLYLEAGTGLGNMSSGDTFFGTPTANTSNFSASFAAYSPVTPPSSIGHIALGLHARATSGAAASGTALSFGSANLSLRAEFWRFFAGAGYSPISYISKKGSGFLGLKGQRESCSYFIETGAIWRVIPEFQIIGAVSLETGLTQSVKSPLITEYGLRFRFPLDPKERPSGGGQSFDGYRYPFGIMK